MEVRVVWILSACLFSYKCCALSVSGKLDFGDSPTNRASLVRNYPVHKHTFTPETQSSTYIKVNNNDDLDTTKSACSSDGCNITKSTNDPNDTIKTDVVVHIESKLDLKPNNDKVVPVGDTPDVPIVIGTDTSNPNNPFSTDQKSIFIPSNQPSYPSNVYRTTYGQSYPDISSPNQFYPNRRYDGTNGFQDRNSWPSELNTNGNSIPPITVQIPDPNRNMVIHGYNNGVELNVPRFDTTLHSHYFGERPPPQTAFYSRRTSIMNPVEFKIMRPMWQPSSWQNIVHNYRYNGMPHAMVKGVQCDCGRSSSNLQLQQNINKGRNIPHSDVRSSINDPGAQINDKLGSFN